MRRAATTLAAAARARRGLLQPSCCCRRSSPSSMSPGCQTWYDRALLLLSHREFHVYLRVLLAGLKEAIHTVGLLVITAPQLQSLNAYPDWQRVPQRGQ